MFHWELEQCLEYSKFWKIRVFETADTNANNEVGVGEDLTAVKDWNGFTV